jgi:predicted metal-dependent peptidase
MTTGVVTCICVQKSLAKQKTLSKRNPQRKYVAMASKIVNKQAREKLIRARSTLFINNGFFGFLAMQLILEEITEPLEKHKEIYGQVLQTMAVDGVRMYYWPPFVMKLTDRELEAVVAHEVMHCCFKHFTRRQSRDPRGWNVAGDFVINNDLIASGFTLPVPHLADPKYNGMTTEEVYDLLPKIYIKSGSGSEDGNGDGVDPGNCGGVLDAPGNKGDADKVGQDWESSVRMAVNVARNNNAGQIPASLARLVGELKRPKVSWRDRTRNFVDQSMTKDVSWARINRRSVSLGVLMPGYVSDRLNHLVMIADTSSSVSMPMLTEFLSECAGALDQGTADQMTVIYADAAVCHVDNFVPGDLVAVPKDTNIGGGGTNFRPAFNYVKSHIPDASCVIYLTDMETCDFGDDPGCPTLWAVYTHGSRYDHLANSAPFGQAIHVSNPYD